MSEPAAQIPHVSLYRYRSARAVLEQFEELEQQEIYFSKTADLNDPMEGFKDLYWAGDEIVWRALLKHYVFSLLETAVHVFTTGHEFDRGYVDAVVLSVPGDYPDAPIKGIYERLATFFLSEAAVTRFIAYATSSPDPIRRIELLTWLRTLHHLVLFELYEEFRKANLWSSYTPPPQADGDMTRSTALKLIEQMEKIRVGRDGKRRSEAGFFAAVATSDELHLVTEARLTNREGKGPLLYLGDFPQTYLNALGRIVHSDWYVACFTKRPDNHSMWSTYGDGHRGVCLIFNFAGDEPETPKIEIERVVGASSSRNKPTTYTKRFVPHEAHAVRYATEYPAIDFFRSLGRIREVAMNNFWFRGDDGKFSACRDAIYADQGKWRDEYWKTFTATALYKTPEWQHEAEYRVIAHSFFDMSDPKERKLKYRFKDLVGIVFGARTSTEDKIKIIDIINRKCAQDGRTDFQFHEVRYTPDKAFKVFEMRLLKLPMQKLGA